MASVGALSQKLQFLISANADEAIKVFQKTGTTAEKELGKAESKIDKVGAGLTKFGAGAMAFSGVAAAGLYKLGQAASDTAESVNAVNTTFGDAAEGVLKLSDNAAQAVGMSKADFNELSVSLAGFAQQMGGDVVGTVDEMTTRIADFASTMNLDVSEAATTFRSALAGESEAMRRYGIDISAAAVETYALANGITDSAGSMTEAQKVQARYGLLLQETSKWAGDFANTADGAANQQRILRAEMANAASEIGAGILPIMANVVTVIGNVAEGFGKLPGPVKTALGGVAGFGTVALGAAGALSFIAGQVIKFRTNLGGLSKHLYTAETGLTNLGAGVVTASVALAGLAQYQATAAKRQKEFNETLIEGAKLTGDAFDAWIAELAAKGALAGKNLTETFVELGDTMPGTLERARDALDAYARSVGGTNNLSANSREILSAVNEAIAQSGERHRQAVIDAEASAQAQAQYNAEAEAGAVSTTEAADRAEYYSSRLAAIADEAKNAKNAGKRLSDAVDEQKSAFEQAADAADAFRTALEQAMGGGINFEEANQAVIEGIAALSEAVKENGTTLDINTEKGRTNRDAIADQVSNIKDMAAALVEQGASADDAAGYTKAYRQQLIDQAVAAGYSRDEVEAYIDQLGLTPENIDTSVKIVDAEVAKTELLGVLEKMDEIDAGTEAEIQALIDEGKFDEARRRLDDLGKEIVVKVSANVAGIFDGGYYDAVPGTLGAPAPPVTTIGAQGRSASGGKPAVMSANSLWQRAMSAWGSRGGKDRLTEEEKKARKEQNDFERDMKHARKKYEVGDYSAQRYFNVLVAIQEKYGWNRLSDNWMTIWREMDSALGEIARAAEELQQQADSAGGSSSGSSSSAGSMSSGGSGGATIALDGGRRVTNINIHLKGLFVGTEAEMRKAVRPLVPAISRELDRYEKG